jgi:hypothetical protein
MITSAPARWPARGVAALTVAACTVVLASACSASRPHAQPGTRSPTPAATRKPSASPAATRPGTARTPPPPGAIIPRCHTRQLAAAFTGLNGASGGQRGMTLILTNRSAATCYVYGYAGLGLRGSGDRPLPTHLGRVPAPHTRVVLRPGQNAQAMVTWRVSSPTPPDRPEYPQLAAVTPPDEYTYLLQIWPSSEPVNGGDLAIWPFSAAPPGPVPTGTGTIQGAFSPICVTAAGNGSANGTKVVIWACDGRSSQQWTAYSDGTLRINGKCLDTTGHSTKIGATVGLWACDGRPTQQWQIGQVSSNPFGPIQNAGTGNVLTDPGHSTINGTQLWMGPDHGDQSEPWHVSFRHYASF